MSRTDATPPRLIRAVGLALAMVLVSSVAAGCGEDGPSREEIRAFLDSTFEADPDRSDTWLSDEPVDETADTIEAEIGSQDRVEEDDAVFMRDGDWAVAVFPEPSGSRIEYDDYDRIRRRYVPFIGGFWGATPGSYGPRGGPGSGSGGGGFRGGGPGVGK